MSHEQAMTAVEETAAAKNDPKPGTKAALEAEIAELKAQLAQKTEAPAAQETKAAPKAQPERVEIFVPKGYANDEPFMIISVNGENHKLPRGKTSAVLPHIAREFYRSQRAQDAMDKRIDAMLSASK